VRGDEQSVTNSGKLLHARGPAATAIFQYNKHVMYGNDIVI